MSRSFVNVSLIKLKYVNKIKYLPTDVIEIIKSFSFIDFEEAERIRYYQHIKAITNQLIKSAFSRSSTIEEMVYGYGADWAMAEPVIDSNSNFWIFGFSDDSLINEERWDFNVSSFNYLNRQDLQLQRIISSFTRFEYTIKASFQEADYFDGLQERYDSLMSYLNV